MERMFNTKSESPEAMAREWDEMPTALREMLGPFRHDTIGVPAVRFVMADGPDEEGVIVDVNLIRHASRDDLGQALKFIMCEIRAYDEGLLIAAKSGESPRLSGAALDAIANRHI